MNDTHDWVDYFRWASKCVRKGKLKRPPGQLFCLDHEHGDGMLVLLGRDRRPMYVVVAAHGPVESDNLFQFIDTLRRQLHWIHIIGSTNFKPPWFVIGALRVTQSTSQLERDEMESRIPLIIEKLKELYKRRTTNN